MPFASRDTWQYGRLQRVMPTACIGCSRPRRPLPVRHEAALEVRSMLSSSEPSSDRRGQQVESEVAPSIDSCACLMHAVFSLPEVDALPDHPAARRSPELESVAPSTYPDEAPAKRTSTRAPSVIDPRTTWQESSRRTGSSPPPSRRDSASLVSRDVNSETHRAVVVEDLSGVVVVRTGDTETTEGVTPAWRTRIDESTGAIPAWRVDRRLGAVLE